MRESYLEVTFRRGRLMTAYLHLPRLPGDKSCKTSMVSPGVIIDHRADGQPIGIEITAPTEISITGLNEILNGYGISELTADDVAPLKAAA